MWHLLWLRTPASAPPPGASLVVRSDGLVEVYGPPDVIQGWQLQMLRAGELAPEDLFGSGRGAAPTPAPAEVSRAEYDAITALLALPAGATATQLRTATAAIKAARGT